MPNSVFYTLILEGPYKPIHCQMLKCLFNQQNIVEQITIFSAFLIKSKVKSLLIILFALMKNIKQDELFKVGSDSSDTVYVNIHATMTIQKSELRVHTMDQDSRLNCFA